MTVDPTSLGYDLACLDDLDPDMSECSELDCLVQDILHRWETPRGWLLDDPEYGRDIREDLSRAMTLAELQSLPASYAAEALKDERVFSCAPRVLELSGETISVEFKVESSLGPFRLTVDVSQAGPLVREVSS